MLDNNSDIQIFTAKKIIEERCNGKDLKFKILWESNNLKKLLTFENLKSCKNLINFLDMKEKFDILQFRKFREYCKYKNLDGSRQKKIPSKTKKIKKILNRKLYEQSDPKNCLKFQKYKINFFKPKIYRVNSNKLKLQSNKKHKNLQKKPSIFYENDPNNYSFGNYIEIIEKEKDDTEKLNLVSKRHSILDHSFSRSNLIIFND